MTGNDMLAGWAVGALERIADALARIDLTIQRWADHMGVGL